MNTAERWREQAEAIREQARPLVARADAIKGKMKRVSEFQSEALLAELQQLNRRIGSMARRASDADAMGRGEVSGLR